MLPEKRIIKEYRFPKFMNILIDGGIWILMETNELQMGQKMTQFIDNYHD
jgi:hypothetical protein